jgi:hypothetical protein
MRYPDRQEARLGDRVQLWKHNEGTVVCSLDTNEYTSSFRSMPCLLKMPRSSPTNIGV